VLAAAGDLSADEQNNVDVYRKYSVGVVNITSSTMALNFYLQPVPVEAGTGSGVILDTNGNIVTNYHVIEPSLNGGGLEVTLADKSKYAAKIVGKDLSNDLAVIRIEAPKDKLSPIPFGRSTGLLVGQKVLAIGNPFGFQRTMTTGIISATGRSIRAENDRVIENVIQTDAAINPGNSGGPLLNRAGEIIGINAQIASPTTGSAGIGFAIPADTVQGVVKDLITYGYVRRPYLGISGAQSMAPYPPGLLRQLGIPSNDGFMLTRLSPGGPAQLAGLREVTGQVRYGLRLYPVGGDVVVAFEGKETSSPIEVADAIAHFKAGEKVTLTILRGGKRMDVPVTLKETTAEMQ
jgi:putative serine protease PepD